VKALTICQPYAHLIVLPDDDDRAKRVENRRWPTSYRGPLLIHAGKSREWLDLDSTGLADTYGIPLASMVFGAIVGVCKVVDCFTTQHPMDKDSAIRRRPWLAGHQHIEGPFCFVLAECRAFDKPIPCRGAQGFFNVPDEVVRHEIGGLTT
jgi:hypothetical protein